MGRTGPSNHNLEQSFLAQRRGMALLAGLFPIVFLVSSLLLERTPPQTSLSACYWTFPQHLPFERNFFVGALCSLSVSLVLYKGYSQREDRV